MQGTLSDYTSLKIPKKYLNAAIKNKTPFSASMMENGTELSGWETYTPNSYDDIKMIYNNDLEMCIEILRPYYNADTATISHILYKITLSKAMNSIQYVKENYTEQVPDTEKETESTSPSEADMMVQAYIEATNKVSDEGLTLMQKVLLNKIDYNNGHKIEETKSIFYQNMNGTTFYIVDLDCDGNDEVCVNYYPGYVLIFHEIDKKIYGYERFYRDFSPVYKDGTFESTGGASVNSFRGKISFTESEFCYEIITWVETNYSDHVTHYYKNGAPHTDECVEITQEEYDEIMAGYTKEEAKEYDFTIENILKYVE